MSAITFKRSENFGFRGANFYVKVHHWTEPCPPGFEHLREDEGDHRWGVYAFIYPTHPRFSKFAGKDMWQPAAMGLPLHCGPSMLTWHRDNDGEVTSVEVGADYHHLYDKPFTHVAEFVGSSIERDARKLIEFLTTDTGEGEGKP